MKHVLILLLSLTFWGCNTSVESQCEDLAAMQCEKCESCASGDAVRSAAFCNVNAGDNCVEKLTQNCGDGASILPDPKGSLDQCEEELGSLQCSIFYRAEAQGKVKTVDACNVFF